MAGVATELLKGLADMGHQIDCFSPGSPTDLPLGIREHPNIKFVWSGSRWQWGRWYSRGPLRAIVTGLGDRAIGFARLRRSIVRRHASNPYDLLYQFSNIETFGVPRSMARSVPLVIHPEAHCAGECRWLVAERHLGWRCQRPHHLAGACTVFLVRAVLQRVAIQRASLLICISGVFRDQLVNDYGFPRRATLVVPNPVRLHRFGEIKEGVGHPPTAVIIGRISVRKGVEQIVALSRLLKERRLDLRLRIIGGHSQWSDYRPLLEDLEPTNAECVGPLAAHEIPDELEEADMLIQASKYEPFGLTVAEALAAGVPVVATSEVGALEGVSRLPVVATRVGDPEALADAVEEMLGRLRADASGVRHAARADAQRLFSADIVCRRISDALQDLVAAGSGGGFQSASVRR